MRNHPVIGERILSSAPAMAPVAKLVRSTHERWDGGGYPDGLAEDQIPLGSRLIAVCDAFVAMTESPALAATLSVRGGGRRAATRAPARSSTRRWWRPSAPSCIRTFYPTWTPRSSRSAVNDTWTSSAGKRARSRTERLSCLRSLRFKAWKPPQQGPRAPNRPPSASSSTASTTTRSTSRASGP